LLIMTGLLVMKLKQFSCWTTIKVIRSTLSCGSSCTHTIPISTKEWMRMQRIQTLCGWFDCQSSEH
jgi:hypothetical protein